MLKQRVITALILLVILGAAMLAPVRWPLLAIFVLMSTLACWEWERLSLSQEQQRWAWPLALLNGALMLWLSVYWYETGPQGQAADLVYRGLVPLMAALWIVGATGLVLQGQATQRAQRVLLSVMGVLAPLVAWASLYLFLHTQGIVYVLSLLVLIWVADIAAYFAGRAFGKAKLAPRVSPGKTWAGAVGGMVAAAAWMLISANWTGSFGADVLQRWGWVATAALGVALAALSIVGDLFESLLKRRAAVKDSSQLLPGHGGVYDRIDALLPVAPVALLLSGAWLF
ncbi:phosphatidate cytidylyltransferase [Alcaligenes faecalis]|uniref:phosphatidate cytidylyltransferase n=1 Tax=Alcaligenes faecalis TaxID=511 RepID=UPI0005A78515|nr:phosphatidate cytidylyltransferase [Alcaligenes faecalis]ATH99785.1 phosphatidate cytidylyltransferase [Alcaligenes faecalis]AYZ92572.1 phosphatidate cytidylyltransferase [Alcaligenes faecalis]MCX5593332.1 phosphatidate cytidylyltransferase [Alcaligenes faecalis]QQC31620.1 phosphatidate cytidylyltransferase [Alcaligenes faecalis]CAJ0904706.1 Phosphatidate cytidylyltransferase [Alcaligenes faecalis subsp. faecalis]